MTAAQEQKMEEEIGVVREEQQDWSGLGSGLTSSSLLLPVERYLLLTVSEEL